MGRTEKLGVKYKRFIFRGTDLSQGVQPNFSEKCGNVGMAMKMWEFFLNVGIIEKM